MKNFIAMILLVVSSVGSAFAVPVTINDGDEFTYNPASEYYFNAVLSESNPTVTFGASIAQGEAFDFIVAAPSAIDLFARLSTGPDFGGIAIVNPEVSRVFAGTSFTFPIDGDFFVGQTQWLTVSIDGIIGAIDYLATLPGGVLPIGAVLGSPETSFAFLGDDTTGNGNSGNNNNGSTTPVPEPGTLALLSFSLLLLGFTKKQVPIVA